MIQTRNMEEEISFGVWLRKQRRALDLTRQAFADQVGCAEVTLRRIEAGTLKPSKELASILLKNLGIPEPERLQWISFARGLSGFPAQSPPSSNKPKSNLPASITTFIGREKEQSDVIRLIAKHRLVALTGPGGVGKTRLSIKVGEQVLENYVDGVWLVELAPITNPLLVPRTTAIAVGIRDEPQRPVVDMLSDYLRGKKIVLILDNCEHLLDACAQLADMLLKRCPDLKILATSREALGILGEAVYPVPSLELPEIQQLVEKLRDYESVRLFEERAQLARMDFSLTVENARSVAKICSQLDGIPLAIELAAVHISTFSTQQIAERLKENFSLLSTGNRTALPRHQTLQATIDWSYDLLSPVEQTLFRRLSVFVNGWTLEAAESICSDVNIMLEDIRDLLTHLANKSLVIVEELQVGTRYRFHETIRQYTGEKLIESGESSAVCDRHLEYFLNFAEAAEPYLIRHEQIEWLPLLDADYENLRLALEWALSKEIAQLSLRLATALGWFWVIRCYWLEGLDWIKRALAKPYQNGSMSEKVARARALLTQADLEWQLDGFPPLAPAQAALALASEVSDKRDIAIAGFYIGSALRLKDVDQALSLMEQSFAEFQALNDPFWLAYSFPYLSEVLALQARLKSQDRAVKSLELARKAGERRILADALIEYADWLFRNNRVDEAREHAEESDRLYKQIESDNARNPLLIAEIAWSNGDYEKARSLCLALQERFSLLGEKFLRSECLATLGALAIDEGNLDQAQTYLEQGLGLAREAEYKPFIARWLIELGNLYYFKGDFESCKENFRESLSLKVHFLEAHKVAILETILGALYLKKPKISSQFLGIIDHSEREYKLLLGPIVKRYCSRAEIHARKTLGDAVFESAFAEGQRMSLDQALDLALKTVEEIG